MDVIDASLPRIKQRLHLNLHLQVVYMTLNIRVLFFRGFHEVNKPKKMKGREKRKINNFICTAELKSRKYNIIIIIIIIKQNNF